MLAFILSGSIRSKIVACLVKKPSYAYQIACNKALNISSVYRALRDLKEKKIVECPTPGSKKLKIFKLTPEALKLKVEVLESLL